MEYHAVAANVARIPGFLVPGQERWLFDTVRSLADDAVIVEVGSLYGRSSCAMGFACVGTRRRVFCIDPWKYAELGDLDFFERWQANVRANALEAHVTPLRGRSHDVLARWAELTGDLPIDFIFIDGWHEYASVLCDFELAFARVKRGGRIALHDVCDQWPGPLRVWEQTAGPSLSRHERCSTIACGTRNSDRIVGPTGVAPAAHADPPVHYFTEAADATTPGSQLAVLRQLDFDWRWHIVGGETSPAVRAVVANDPRVLLHTTDGASGAENRLTPLSAMLAAIPDECILWRLDPQDSSNAVRLAAGRAMLLEDPRRTALAFRRAGATRPIAWHCHPWFRWTCPDAPLLAAFLADGAVVDVAAANPLVLEGPAALDQPVRATHRPAA